MQRIAISKFKATPPLLPLTHRHLTLRRGVVLPLPEEPTLILHYPVVA